MLDRLSRTSAGTVLLILAIMAAAALILRAMGHGWVCDCGVIRLWEPDLRGAQASQQVTDWFTFSHLGFGLIVYLGLHLLVPHWTLRKRLVVAAMIFAGWEMGENTPALIDRYRMVTASTHYDGDAIVNSLGDMSAGMLGFGLAAILPVWAGVGIVLAAEGVSLLAARDGLVLGAIMFMAPIDAVRSWQTSV